MYTSKRTTTTPLEAAGIVAICFGWAILSSFVAVASGFPSGGSGTSAAFSDRTLIWTACVELLLGGAALLVLRARRYWIHALQPRPQATESALGVVLYLAAWLVGAIIVSPFAASQPNQPIDRMVEQASLSLPVLVFGAMVNGTYEEVFLLGFLQRGLRNHGRSMALGITLLVRLLYHLYQGPIGALWVAGIGLVFGAYFLRTDKLWPPVFAHILADIVPFAMR